MIVMLSKDFQLLAHLLVTYPKSHREGFKSNASSRDQRSVTGSPRTPQQSAVSARLLLNNIVKMNETFPPFSSPPLCAHSRVS